MAISLSKMISKRKLCFYDLETFYKYSCFVFYVDGDFDVIEFGEDMPENEKSTKRLWRVYNDALNEYLMIGYNCKKYDNLILLKLFEFGMPETITPQKINDLSDQIICQQTLKWANIPEGFLSYDVYNFKNHMPSLKIVGTLFGGDIRETPISFSYKGSFTKKQKEDIVFYCKHDVNITKLIFNSPLGQKYFEMENKTAEVAFNEVRDVCSQGFVYRLYSTGCDHYEEIVKALSKYGYKAPDGSPEDEFKIKKPHVILDVAKMIKNERSEIFRDVVEFFYSEGSYKARASGDKEALKFEAPLRDGVTVSYGLGGAHGTTEEPLFVKNGNGMKILHADFSAMYPSIMIAYDYFPPGLPQDIRAIFKKFADARDGFKKAGDKISSDAYKPILNSVPGRFRYQYSKLYHPATNLSICALGQTLITAMSLMVEGRVIQVDTDGIMALCTDEEYGINVHKIDKFSELIGLKIKVESFNWFAQQNIHSYAFSDSDGNVGGIGGFFGGKSEWDPNLMGIQDIIQRCLMTGMSVKSSLTEHIKKNGTAYLTIVSKTTEKFFAFTIQDFTTGQISKFNNRYLLSVAVIGTKARELGFKPVSIMKEGEGKTQKISSFPPVVCNVNKLEETLPLEIIDLDFYADLIASKMAGIMGLCGIAK